MSAADRPAQILPPPTRFYITDPASRTGQPTSWEVGFAQGPDWSCRQIQGANDPDHCGEPLAPASTPAPTADETLNEAAQLCE